MANKNSSSKGNVKKTFAIIGLIDDRKGQDILLRAIDMLPEPIRIDSRFIIAGPVRNHAIEKKIIQKIKEYPNQIAYFGELPHTEVCKIYEDIDYLICSSRDDPGPSVVAEAMSLGKPCVCSCNTGLAEIVRDYHSGYTYKNNYPEKLADSIVKAFKTREEDYRQMSVNSRKAYEEIFSEKVFDINVCEILNLLTSGTECGT